jgi:hypothetical protein
MKPTPRSTVLGLFSDLVNLPLQYMSSPERTQQMQGTAQFLYGTGIPKTLERLSYGESLFSGAGGLGGTTRMRPETAEALMNVAPLAPAAGRLTARAVRATEGLPVGMGIKDVSKRYPQQAALDLAQQRAALPVEQGGLGLPANNTAMDRARAMGFRVKDEMFHGTTEPNIVSFRPTPHDETHIYGTSLTRTPNIADFYARGRSFSGEVEGANIIPVYIRGKKPIDFDKFTDYAIEQNLFSNKTADLTPSAQRFLNKRNIAGYDMENLYGDEIQVLDPSRIRSRFAAFDPFRKDVATATAMGVALPDLLAQPVRQYKPPQDTIPMYTDPFGNTIGSSIR